MFYRVRKTWEDKSSQIGTFTVQENAILMVDANPGYAVFDENGSQIYPRNELIPERYSASDSSPEK